MSDTPNTRLEIEGRIARLTIDRPRALNALNAATIAELRGHVRSLKVEDLADVLILTGGGEKSFVAGADIKEMATMSPMEARAFSQVGQQLMLELRDLPIPTIAAVGGYALGGGMELAMACDLIYGSDNALFGQPEVGLGVIPGFGGTQRLARLVGPMVAKRLCMTGDKIKAEEAQRLGLLAGVFPRAELMEGVGKVAKTLQRQGPVAVRLVKEVIDAGLQTDLDRALIMETQAFALCFSTEDQREGMEAFGEKRRPVFQGK